MIGAMDTEPTRDPLMESAADNATRVLDAARAALHDGENFLAYDLAEKAPDDGVPSPQKIHVMSLALARSGALNRATELAAQLPDSDDPEIAGLKSRLFKDMALASHDTNERRALFAKAARHSAYAFARKGAWYNGINAASCLFMAGARDAARRLVRNEVLPRCQAEETKDLWLDATLGECHLLLGDYQRAAEFYGKAVASATENGHFGNLSSTLRQLRMLIAEIGARAQCVWEGLPLPRIAVFSGHMIDRPGRTPPRFPASAENGVRAKLREIVARRAVKIAFASCACGGDILFLEEVLSSGGECVVVPPLPLPATVRNSVSFAGGDWETRLEAILADPRTRLLAPECDETGEDDEVVYDFTNRYLLGLALLKSRSLGFPLLGVCVWDGRDSGSTGGTDSAVKLWRERGLDMERVTPEAGE